MALTNSQYNHIMKAYDEKQYRCRHELEKRQKQVDLQIPEYKELSARISSLCVQYGKELLNGDDTALLRLKEETALLREQKAGLLKKAGFPATYLTPTYECRDCKDTGYIGQEKCHCFRQQIIEFLYEQSNIKEFLKENNFSRLSPEYYTGEDLLRFQNAVKTCREFIDNFNLDYHNLFFYGTVGTGKSFLSGCIAKELMDAGHSVIYFSSAGLFERISQASFDYHDRDTLADLYEDLYSCDLLIIDDLGTELTNHFSSSHFFSCLNERIQRKKSIIISTNLSLQELRDRYSDRIFSRITSNFDLCKITGQDIRMHQKRVNNRK